MEPIRIEFSVDDDGVVIEVRRGWGRRSLIALGIAMHEGKGVAETFSRARINASRELRGVKASNQEQE